MSVLSVKCAHMHIAPSYDDVVICPGDLVNIIIIVI
jgi:hypothetical protein